MGGGYSLHLVVDDIHFIPSKQECIACLNTLHACNVIPLNFVEILNETNAKGLKLEIQQEIENISWNNKDSISLYLEVPINGNFFTQFLGEIFGDDDSYYLSSQQTMPTGSVRIKTRPIAGIMSMDHDWGSKFEKLGVFLGNPEWDYKTTQYLMKKFLEMNNDLIGALEAKRQHEIKIILDFRT